MASGVSNTIFSPSDPNHFCDKLKLLLQQKQAGNNSNIIDTEIVAIVDELLEYKCIYKTSWTDFDQMFYFTRKSIITLININTSTTLCINKHNCT